MKKWIQKEIFLISKITASLEYKNFKTKKVTAYDPQIDIKIPEDKLSFSALK
jgi:hypothetical protein